MADFFDREASESENDEEAMDVEESESRKTSPSKKKVKAVISSDEEDDDEEEEDEEKAREEMKGFIADDDDEADDNEDDEGHSRRRRRRSRSRSEDEEDIDEEDRELLQENLGIKIKKTRKRIRMDSGSGSDEDQEPQQSRQVSIIDDEESSDRREESMPVDSAAHMSRAEAENDVEAGYESEDVNDFIVDDDNKPIQRERKKKRTHIFTDSARQEAEDTFGVAFDYDEFDKYNEDEDGEDEYNSDDEDNEDLEDEPESLRRKRSSKRASKTAQQYDSVQLTDVPERMQTRIVPVTAVPEGSDELEREAEWILRRAFTEKPISIQKDITRITDDYQNQTDLIDRVKKALDYMRQQNLEVPFIAAYRKEYVEPLKSEHLWRIYKFDALWCKLQSRKANLKKLFESMKVFQEEKIMALGAAALPDDIRIIHDDDINKVESIDSFEELKDRDQHFKLYYAHDIDAMNQGLRQKKKEEKLRKKQEKLLSKKSKRKTKTIVNDEGEEVEVTDEEAGADDDEDENEDEDDVNGNEEDAQDQAMTLKHANRSDPFTLCKKYKIAGIGKSFGLTSEQFGENLAFGVQMHSVEEEQIEPVEVANGYVNDKFPSAEDVLHAAKFMVATQISRDPDTRKAVREAFRDRATITVRPTKKGLKDIDESHDCYGLKYLSKKPVNRLRDDEWLRLVEAEKQKLITLELAEHITSASREYESFMDEAKDRFRVDRFSAASKAWNELRADCVEIAFEKMLYPVMRSELRFKLVEEAKQGLVSACCKKLRQWLNVARYSAQLEDRVDDDEWDESQGCRVMGVMYDSDPDVASYAIVVAPDGEPGDLIKLEHIRKRRNAYNEREREQKERDLEVLKNFIRSQKPHCVVIGVIDRTAINIKEDIEEIIRNLVEEEQFPDIKVNLLDDNLAKVYSNSSRAEQDFRQYPKVLREAISLARRMQDPLTEFAQLANTENEILCLRYHPLQDLLSEEELLEGLNIEFISMVNSVGVDINECVAHPHKRNLMQFIGGLGPKKGSALIRTLRQVQGSNRLENRQQLVTLCHMGPKVLINCAGFIKIDTASLGDSEVYVEVLDGSRIHNEAYDWARKMAVDALEYDEDDGNPANALEEILQEPEKLGELDLDAFADELENQGFGKKHITLQDIRDELHHMYKDKRPAYEAPHSDELFEMVTKSSKRSLEGRLMTALVTGMVYKRPQGDELDKAEPIRNGDNWKCPFCGQDDFAELAEVWNHFDAGTCPGRSIGAKLRIDSPPLNGFVSVKNISDSSVTSVAERVVIGQNVNCRIIKVNPDRFSVDCTCRSSDLIDANQSFRGSFAPLDAFYDAKAEQADEQNEEEKKRSTNRQSYIKRVIVHPNFYNIGYKEAERLMRDMDQGDVIIRPSSKGDDHLTVTWKLDDHVCHHIDVKEESKTNAFSLGKSLWIGNNEFEDLDEIIARHINPMAAHARDILSFKNYKDTQGGKREVAEEQLRIEKRANPGKIHYLLSSSKDQPGKFMLSYMPRNRARHEYISVTPDGFRFRHQNFETLSQLMKWFKEHFRDAVPGRTPLTPATTGRSTMRTTPYAITPGAMSLAQGTPRGVGDITPYTPSGQTPYIAVTPRVGGTTPRVGGTTPRVGGTTPRVGGSMSRVGGTTPRVGGTTPRVGGTTPRVGGTTPRAGGSTPRGGGSTPRIGGSTPNIGLSPAQIAAAAAYQRQRMRM